MALPTFVKSIRVPLHRKQHPTYKQWLDDQLIAVQMIKYCNENQYCLPGRVPVNNFIAGRSPSALVRDMTGPTKRQPPGVQTALIKHYYKIEARVLKAYRSMSYTGVINAINADGRAFRYVVDSSMKEPKLIFDYSSPILVFGKKRFHIDPDYTEEEYRVERAVSAGGGLIEEFPLARMVFRHDNVNKLWSVDLCVSGFRAMKTKPRITEHSTPEFHKRLTTEPVLIAAQERVDAHNVAAHKTGEAPTAEEVTAEQERQAQIKADMAKTAEKHREEYRVAEMERVAKLALKKMEADEAEADEVEEDDLDAALRSLTPPQPEPDDPDAALRSLTPPQPEPQPEPEEVPDDPDAALRSLKKMEADEAEADEVAKQNAAYADEAEKDDPALAAALRSLTS